MPQTARESSPRYHRSAVPAPLALTRFFASVYFLATAVTRAKSLPSTFPTVPPRVSRFFPSWLYRDSTSRRRAFDDML